MERPEESRAVITCKTYAENMGFREEHTEPDIATFKRSVRAVIAEDRQNPGILDNMLLSDVFNDTTKRFAEQAIEDERRKAAARGEPLQKDFATHSATEVDSGIVERPGGVRAAPKGKGANKGRVRS